MRQVYTCYFGRLEVWHIRDVMEVASWTLMWHIESRFDERISSFCGHGSYTYGWWCLDKCDWLTCSTLTQTSWKTCYPWYGDYFMDIARLTHIFMEMGWTLDLVDVVAQCSEKWLMMAWGGVFSRFGNDTWISYPTSSSYGDYSSVPRDVRVGLEYHRSSSHDDDAWWESTRYVAVIACSLSWRE